MSREIKFRGKRIDNGEWVYGDLLTTRNKASCDSAIVFFDGCMLPKAESVLKETVGQYTGLKDKNGVEIYEGDILKSKFGGIGEVRWQKESAMFRYYKRTGLNEYGEIVKMVAGTEIFYHGANEFEVVGNICEPPYSTNKGGVSDGY